MSAEPSLRGKKALVTGAGRGIGRAIAERLAAAGADVAVNYHRSADGADEAAQSCRASGVRARTYQADISRADDVKAMVEAVQRDLGEIDILVNNAAIITGKRLLEVTEELWDEIVDINLKGTFLCTQAVAASMLRRNAGCVVNLASAWGANPRAGGLHPGVPYVASKGGVINLTRALAYELRPHVRVNAVAPGVVISKPGMFNDSGRQRVLQHTQLARLGAPDDIADVVLFLASDAARFITGQILTVDGGLD